ncbi:MAG: STAS domain-containing protein [Candidatus Omnitrophota bacterium]
MREPSGKMELVKEIKDVKILKVSGDFTLETTPEFQKLCKKVSSKKKTAGIILDFNEAEKIDTAAFACMINFMKENMRGEVKIGIINLKKREKDLINILKIGRVIRIFDTEPEAVKALGEIN